MRRAPGRAFLIALAIFTLAIPRSSSAPALAQTPLEANRLEVPFDPNPATPKGLPAGWRMQRHRGEPEPVLEKRGGRFYLRLVSRGDKAYGIRKEMRVDLREFPYLQWTWKAVRLPLGGDVRRRDADDQALQMYVIFPGSGVTARLSPTALAYVWDNRAPKGFVAPSPQPSMRRVRYVVLRNGTDPLGTWVTERRNIRQDASALFRDLGLGEPPPAEGILLFINTHKTGTEAEGLIGDIHFSSR
ncbi:MAG: DUF3047 domain-containing protein [Syntrophaceae bacterium]|nr:DUF3047 domain-containing protein [Syntrophaceae bacterium]